MESCHAHVVDAVDLVAVELRDQRGLLGDREVARARAGHEHRTEAGRGGHLAEDTQACLGMIGKGHVEAGRIGRGVIGLPTQGSLHPSRLVGGEAGHQHPTLSGCGQRTDDARDLIGRLALAVDHLRGTLPHLPVEVHLGIAQVLKGLLAQGQHCLVHREGARAHALEYFAYVLTHEGTTTLTATSRGAAASRRAAASLVAAICPYATPRPETIVRLPVMPSPGATVRLPAISYARTLLRPGKVLYSSGSQPGVTSRTMSSTVTTWSSWSMSRMR